MSGESARGRPAGRRKRFPATLRSTQQHQRRRIVRGRSRRPEDFWAVRDVTLQIPKGSVYGLIGHNGSGKSTLLKMIGGIYRPTTGSITTDGRVAALIELGAGFHPDMTGREEHRPQRIDPRPCRARRSRRSPTRSSSSVDSATSSTTREALLRAGCTSPRVLSRGT